MKNRIAKAPNGSLLTKCLMVSALAIMIYTESMTAAHANVIGAVLCNVAAMMYGNVGRGLATIAVIVLGIGATLGKVSWGLAITVAVGISVIFNASAIIAILVPNGVGC